MRVIKVRLLVEDVMNPSDDEAIEYMKEIISEAFGKEERKDHPRCKLILFDIIGHEEIT